MTLNSIRLLILYSSSLLFMATAKCESESNYIPISVADGPFLIGDMDLLSGFKINVIAGENPLRGKVFEGDITTVIDQSTYQKTQVIDMKKTESEILDFEGALTADFIFITATAQGSYYKEKVTTRNEFKYIYREQKVSYSKVVKNVNSNWLNDQNLTAYEIADKFGTKYIKEIVYGAELDLVYTAKFTKDVDFKSFEAKFEACLFAVACIDIEFSGTEGFSREDFSESFSARLTGMDIPIPTNPNFREVNQFIQNFRSTYTNNKPESIDAINNEKNVLKKLSPIGFYLGCISEKLKYTDNRFDQLDIKRSNLTEIHSSALLLKEQLIAMRDSQRVLYPDPRDETLLLAPYNDAVESVLKKINAKIDECLKYQHLPLEDIIGKEGREGRKVPEKYVGDDKVLDGLLGKKYLPADVTVGKTKFIDMYYSGFALDIDGVMKPWLSGKIYRIKDNYENEIVASATRPENLERLAFKNLNFDESKVRIRAAHQVTSSDTIGSLFKLGEWTEPSFKDATNLQQFEFLNIGSLPLEAKVSYNVTGIEGNGVWKEGQIGKIGGERKKIVSFALRIKGDNTYYSVNYKAKLESGETTEEFNDGELCEKNGAGISAILVKIINESEKEPCDEDSPCHCELSICYKP